MKWPYQHPTYLPRLFLHRLRMLPSLIMDRFGFLVFIPDIRHGIKIVDPNESSKAQFLALMEIALDLIAANDERRFRRLQAEIKGIVNLPLKSWASYDRGERICCFDFRIAQAEDGKYGDPRIWACILVHESCHGYLETKGVIWKKRLRRRIEWICCMEMTRFGKKVGVPENFWWPYFNVEPPSLKERIAFVFRNIRKCLNAPVSAYPPSAPAAAACKEIYASHLTLEPFVSTPPPLNFHHTPDNKNKQPPPNPS
jgi:hypothetical protein